MQQIDLIKEFLEIKQKCPVCGMLLTRKLHAKFIDGSKIEYTSDPKRDLWDYKNLVFTKYQEPTTEQTLLRDKEKKYTDASPSIINLTECTPPSLHYIKFTDVFVTCGKIGVEYQLWSSPPTFAPDMERFSIDGADVVIKANELKELSTQTIMPVQQNMILKYSPKEAVKMIRKLMVIQ